MARILYGPGALGGVVGDIQRTLAAAGFSPGNIDEIYGKNTAAAVRTFQSAQGLAATGVVDEDTWQALMERPIPGTDVRSLELTAAFEGHGYSLAEGNWDGAWLTWGIIGFTMKYGKVQKIVLEVFATAPQLINQAFGENSDRLIQIMEAPGGEQEAWVNTISIGSRLAEPWRSGFARLGQFPEVRREQQDVARNDYFVPALGTAQNLRLQTELGLALCFDIHVQDGGVSQEAAAIIQQATATQPPSTEADVRRIVANAVADTARAAFREDVRQRKLTIALGQGTVHGTFYALENWGLAEVPASELI